VSRGAFRKFFERAHAHKTLSKKLGSNNFILVRIPWPIRTGGNLKLNSPPAISTVYF
jgi:hypothetical protein